VIRLRKFFSSLLNNLNAIGSLLLAYALANPLAASEMLALLPPRLKAGAILAIPLVWFGLVQFAKARTIKKAKDAEALKAKVAAEE
jgi:hypothetical protein